MSEGTVDTPNCANPGSDSENMGDSDRGPLPETTEAGPCHPTESSEECFGQSDANIVDSQGDENHTSVFSKDSPDGENDDDNDDDAVPNNPICVDCTEGETDLIKAVRLNHRDKIRQLIRSGCDCNALCKWEGAPCTVRVERGAFRKQLQMTGYGPLHVAVIHSSRTTIRCLLCMGADVQIRDKNERTALQLAAAVNRPKVVRLLIDSGAEVNTRSASGRSPLMEAVTNVSLELTQMLLRAGADPGLTDIKGTTPLKVAIVTMEARERGPELGASRAIIQSLIDAGCDVDQRNPYGASALMLAAGLKIASVIPMLVEAGANVNLVDNNGCTAFSMAIEGQRSVGMLKELMKHGAASHLPDNKGKTPLSKVLRFGAVSILRFLLSADAVPHTYDIATAPRIVQLRQYLPEFDEWLHHELYEPRSLLRLCREVVRHQMSPHNLPRIHSLGLPRTLNDFVLGVTD